MPGCGLSAVVSSLPAPLMWVVIVTLGTRGDLQPYAVLAAGLAARGHHVTLCAPSSLTSLAQQLAGGTVDLLGLEGDWELLLQEERCRALLNRQDLLGLLKVLQRFGESHYVSNAAQCLGLRLATSGREGSAVPDVVLGNLTAWDLVLPLAEGMCVPYAFIATVPPAFPTSDHPPALLYPRPLPCAWLNRAAAELTHALIRSVLGHSNMDEMEEYQGLAGCRVLTPVPLLVDRVRHSPHLLMYSPTLSPMPAGWDGVEDVTMCGHISSSCTQPQHHHHHQSAGEEDPQLLHLPLAVREQLVQWLRPRRTRRQQRSPPPSSSATTTTTTAVDRDDSVEAAEALIRGPGDDDDDDRPIYVGFGSMMPNKEAIARATLEALMLTGRRGILQRGWAGISGSLLHEDVVPGDAAVLSYARERVLEVEGDLPHAWLFPQCAAIVHHGGCGTTHTALEAGVPQVVVPVAADQPYWAYRVGTLGIGPRRYTPAHRLTGRRLARLIVEATSSKCIGKAREVGEVVRTREDGLGRCIEAVEALDREGGKAFWAGLRAGEEERERRKARRTAMAWALAFTLVIAAAAVPVFAATVKRRRMSS